MRCRDFIFSKSDRHRLQKETEPSWRNYESHKVRTSFMTIVLHSPPFLNFLRAYSQNSILNTQYYFGAITGFRHVPPFHCGIASIPIAG